MILMILWILYLESKNATCEEYSTDTSVTPEIEDVTSLIPLQKSCDGEAGLLFLFVHCTIEHNVQSNILTIIKNLNKDSILVLKKSGNDRFVSSFRWTQTSDISDW